MATQALGEPGKPKVPGWGGGARGLGLNGAMLGSSLSSAMTVWCLQASPEPL